MRASQPLRWGLYGLFAFALVAIGFFILCPTPGRWKTLAEIVDSSGNRLVVAQEHYSWSEGWRVSFTVITPDRKVYGSLLEMQTLPWANVRMLEKDGAVEIWRSDSRVGLMTWSNRTFTNFMSTSSDSYIDGYNGVQGKSARENMYFD
jgi:hypothetical protein